MRCLADSNRRRSCLPFSKLSIWTPGLKTTFDVWSSPLTLGNADASIVFLPLNRGLEGSFCRLKRQIK